MASIVFQGCVQEKSIEVIKETPPQNSVDIQKTPATEGPITSGGGGACVERRDDGSIAHAETYDLWEGAEVFGYKYSQLSSINKSSDEILEVALRRIERDETRKKVSLEVDSVKTHMRFVSAPRKTNDGNFPVIPCDKGFQYEQLAFFLGSRFVLINKEIWEAMDDLSKAAIILHEAVYRMYRLGATHEDSFATRRTVGQLLDDSFEIKNHVIPKDWRVYQCEVDGDPRIKTKFEFAHKGRDARFVFSWLAGSFDVLGSHFSFTLPDFPPFNDSNWKWGDKFENTEQFKMMLMENYSPIDGTTAPTYSTQINGVMNTISENFSNIDVAVEFPV